MPHPSLRNPPSNLIASQPLPLPGAAIRSHNPAHPDQTIWQGSPVPAHTDRAVAAARTALPQWSRAPRETRFAALRAFQRLVKAREQSIADLICDEVGKAMWEAKQEAALLAAKVDITIDTAPGAPLSRVTTFDVPITDTRIGRCLYRPHGVMAVLGPFNFPAHLPNGHIIPALATGNTIIFKPSDKAPAVGQLLGEILIEALAETGAPPGVVNILHGAGDVAGALVKHEGVDGVLFTGSWPVGRKILEANLDTPGRIVALEMGGNNAAVVMDDADLKQAIIECARSAFATAGQRCTCTRRIIIHERIADKFIPAFCKVASALIIGDPRASHPVFMGPVIRAEARNAALQFVESVSSAGAEVLVRPSAIDNLSDHFITPGVLRVDRFSLADGPDAPGRDAGCDIEVFGPIVRLCIVRSLDDAIAQTNASRYGLAASIFTKSQQASDRFLLEAKSGCININTGTAGASSKLPFGGIGHSGNHRPAGAYSLDYCAFPIASMIETSAAAPPSPGMTFDDRWL